MSVIALEILIIFFLTILNGIFAMSETAVVSARKTRLQQLAEGGNRKARLALEVSNSPMEFLSTVQVGITLNGILAGAFGGVTIAQHLASVIAGIALLAPYAETLALGFVVLAITYLSLILGELVPKRIALNNAERISMFIVQPMKLFSRITSPVVHVLNISSSALLWLFRVRRSTEPQVTEEEIRILIRQGTDAGVIHRNERDIIDQIFRIGDRRVSTLMTHRKDLVVLYTTDTPRQIEQKLTRSGHAHYPVCEETLDNVLGIVRAQDILAQSLAGNPLDLKAIVRPPLFFLESAQSLKLLEEFKKTGDDTALLLDEYGGLQGIVTATGILKAILGAESYRTFPTAVRRSDGSWLVDGMLPIDKFEETFKLPRLSHQESQSVETVGGLILVILGRIPSEGDAFTWKQYRFEILDMDGLRVDKILVRETGS